MLEVYKEQFAKYYRQRRIRRGVKLGLVVLIGVLWIVSRAAQSFFSPQQSILVLLVLLVASVEVLETKVYDVESLITRPFQAYLTNHEAKREIANYIDTTDPERAYLVAYSGSTKTSGDVSELTRAGAEVHLLVKDPTSVINDQEHDLVLNTLRPLLEFNWEYDQEVDNLNVRFYEEQASVKATKIDDFLVTSWYTFAAARGREVMGHENASLRVTRDAGEAYTVLNDWFMDVYHSLWTNARTPMELYESDDCPEKFAEMVEGPDEAERKRRLQLISGQPYEGRQQMFPEAT